jgi:hypothetical protein
MSERTVFFLSDQTGVTAETLGHSLLTQFDGQQFRQVTLPFIDSDDKAQEAVDKINLAAKSDAIRPIVFSTLVQDDFRAIIRKAKGLHLDIFDAFLEPLEKELQQKSTHEPGRAHGMSDIDSYMKRIEATNFALANDDGGITRNYEVADVILIGVSRSGKTPTCLYLALQYGVYAAERKTRRFNYKPCEVAANTKRKTRARPIFFGTTGALRTTRGGKDFPQVQRSAH